MNAAKEAVPSAGSLISGFRITRVTEVPELRGYAVDAVHVRTGARLLHVATDDAENLFSVAFRTVPPDDTGVPHILEHTVLGGSRRFPVRDPFVEMLKGSLATYLNAFTCSDRTIYPVAGTVRKDYFNLADVYLDAVFHPNITPMSFRQEGHRLEFEPASDPGGPLTVKGIVYNEMKGAFSDFDTIVGRESSACLFPDTAYRFESGGLPEAIPGLTYEAFLEFYRRNYHPGNARFFTYGDIPLADRLAFLDARLPDVGEPQPLDALPHQPRLPGPVRREVPVPVDAPAGEDSCDAVTVNWLVSEAGDSVNDLAWELLDQLLLGDAGSPLRKALIDSHLGDDLSCCGFDTEAPQGTFHAGLRGCRAEDADRIEALVLRVLEETARTGFPRDRIDAVFRQALYAHREITPSFPIRLMEDVFGYWLHGADPLVGLSIDADLQELQARCLRDPGLFTRLIREGLIANPHRVTLVFRHDSELRARREREAEAALRQRREAMDAGECARVVAEAALLERIQSMPDSPEAVASLPRLEPEDIPRVPRPIPGMRVESVVGLPVLRNDVPANRVTYVSLAFDLSGVPADLFPLVPLFAHAMSRIGADGLDYAAVARALTAATGAFEARAMVTARLAAPAVPHAFLEVRFKALDETVAEAAGLVRRILAAPDFSDRERLADVLLQVRRRLLSGVVPHGDRFAGGYAARCLSGVSAVSETWFGIDALCRVLDLAADPAAGVAALARDFERLHRLVFVRDGVTLSCTGSGSAVPLLGELVSGLPVSGVSVSGPPCGAIAVLPEGGSGVEGIGFSSDVTFCARCHPAPVATDPLAPAASVLAALLNYGYMWDEVRVKGGAYGGSCGYDPVAGIMTLSSYRDPHIERTLDVFDRIGRAARSGVANSSDIQRAIIAAVRGDERPVRPEPATSAALRRHLCGVDDAFRGKWRAALLRVSAADLCAVIERVFAGEGAERAGTCILADPERLAGVRLAGAPIGHILVPEAGGAVEDEDDDE